MVYCLKPELWVSSLSVNIYSTPVKSKAGYVQKTFQQKVIQSTLQKTWKGIRHIYKE